MVGQLRSQRLLAVFSSGAFSVEGETSSPIATFSSSMAMTAGDLKSNGEGEEKRGKQRKQRKQGKEREREKEERESREAGTRLSIRKGLACD